MQLPCVSDRMKWIGGCFWLKIHHFTFSSCGHPCIYSSFIFICTVLTNWQPKLIWCPKLFYARYHRTSDGWTVVGVIFFRSTRSHGVEIYPKFDFDWLSFLIQVEIPVVEPQSISISVENISVFLKLAIHSIVQFFNCDDGNHLKIYLQLGNSMLVWASYNLGRIAYTASTN